MKLAVVILAVIGSALAASIDNEVVIPPFRFKEVVPIGEVPQKSDRALRIVGGREVTPHSIPYQVYIVVNDRSTWTCSGTLITARYVLTTAYCLDGANTLVVRLGAHDLGLAFAEGQKFIRGESWKIHESYNEKTIANDIGVIRLVTAATLSKNIGLARLPTLSDVGANLEGLDAQVSGWGLGDDLFLSTVLRAANNTIISNEECNATFKIVTPNQVCLSGSGARACTGDAGGPLILGNTQIGINSFGAQLCPNGYPGGFTRISQYLNWIQKNTDYVV